MFWRVVKLSGKVYALEVSDLEKDNDNIKAFIETGDVVVLGDDLDEIADMLNIETSDIKIITSDEDDKS